MPDLLVTGTDTAVGKTVIAAALVMALRSRGVRAIGFKPAQTGCEEGEESDADVLACASGERNPLSRPLLHLREPLAPAVAAERAGTPVSPADIEARIDAMRRSGYTVVVEGAGGVLVPLAWGYTALDLAERASLHAIVVGRAGLGTLNHVAMTVAMIRGRSIPIEFVVLNGRRDPPDLAEATNPSALARLLPGVSIVEVAHLTAGTRTEVAAAIAPLLSFEL